MLKTKRGIADNHGRFQNGGYRSTCLVLLEPCSELYACHVNAWKPVAPECPPAYSDNKY